MSGAMANEVVELEVEAEEEEMLTELELESEAEALSTCMALEEEGAKMAGDVEACLRHLGGQELERALAEEAAAEAAEEGLADLLTATDSLWEDVRQARAHLEELAERAEAEVAGAGPLPPYQPPLGAQAMEEAGEEGMAEWGPYEVGKWSRVLGEEGEREGRRLKTSWWGILQEAKTRFDHYTGLELEPVEEEDEEEDEGGERMVGGSDATKTVWAAEEAEEERSSEELWTRTGWAPPPPDLLEGLRSEAAAAVLSLLRDEGFSREDCPRWEPIIPEETESEPSFRLNAASQPHQHRRSTRASAAEESRPFSLPALPLNFEAEMSRPMSLWEEDAGEEDLTFLKNFVIPAIDVPHLDEFFAGQKCEKRAAKENGGGMKEVEVMEEEEENEEVQQMGLKAVKMEMMGASDAMEAEAAAKEDAFLLPVTATTKLRSDVKPKATPPNFSDLFELTPKSSPKPPPKAAAATPQPLNSTDSSVQFLRSVRVPSLESSQHSNYSLAFRRSGSFSDFYGMKDSASPKRKSNSYFAQAKSNGYFTQVNID